VSPAFPPTHAGNQQQTLDFSVSHVPSDFHQVLDKPKERKENSRTALLESEEIHLTGHGEDQLHDRPSRDGEESDSEDSENPMPSLVKGTFRAAKGLRREPSML
jgi:nucleoid DNA-binding protein